jgi:hypothetical protein
MWESRSDFQEPWETKGNLGLVFLVFHAPVISTVLPGFNLGAPFVLQTGE